MNFFKTPPGYKPADSITISLAAAAGVFVVYGSKVGPVADVHATEAGDPNVNAAIKKAGIESLLLVLGLTFLARDLNIAILGGSAVILEHVMYLHGEMSNPANGQIEPVAAAYQPAGGAQLAAVS